MKTLRETAKIAVLWNTGFALFRDVVQFGFTLVLVRLLTPEVYGQYGLVMSIIGFLNIFSSQYFIEHTLQVRNDEDVHYQEHFTAGAGIHVGLFLLTNCMAFAMRWVDSYAATATLVHVMSVLFLISWPSSLRVMMLQRSVDWRRLRLLHSLSLVTGLILSVGLALAGAGVYALLIPASLKHLVFAYDLFLVERWRPIWSWSADKYLPAWRFGLNRMNSGFLGTGRRLLEGTLFVQVVGFSQFGVYGRAVGFAQIFGYQFALVLMQAIYPVLTKMDPGTSSYRRASGLILRTVSWFTIPAVALSAILADPIIRTVYGDQWLLVVPILPWAMAAAAVGALSHTVYMLLLNSQQQSRCLLSDLWMLMGTAVSLVVLLPQGIELYLAGQTLIQLTSLTSIVYWLYQEKNISIGDVGHALLWPVVATVGVGVVCESIKRAVGFEIDNVWAALGYGFGFAIAYLLISRVVFASQLSELVSYFPGSKPWNRLLLLGA